MYKNKYKRQCFNPTNSNGNELYNGLETKIYKHGKKKSICHAVSLFALCRFRVGAN